MTFFTDKAPFPVDSLMMLTVFITVMAVLILIAWWQKAYIALPILITALTAVTYLMVTFQVLTPFISTVQPKSDYGKHLGAGLLL